MAKRGGIYRKMFQRGGGARAGCAPPPPKSATDNGNSVEIMLHKVSKIFVLGGGDIQYLALFATPNNFLYGLHLSHLDSYATITGAQIDMLLDFSFRLSLPPQISKETGALRSKGLHSQMD